MFPCRNIACQSYGKRLNTYGVTSFWDQSAVTFWSMSYDQYFWYIFFMRMKGLIVILLLGTVFGRRIVTRVFLALFLFLTGIFITMSVIEQGLSGIAAVLLAMLPQWIFYLLAFIRSASLTPEPERKRKKSNICLCFARCAGVSCRGVYFTVFPEKSTMTAKMGQIM
jgi:fatty acid desaturase